MTEPERRTHTLLAGIYGLLEHLLLKEGEEPTPLHRLAPWLLDAAQREKLDRRERRDRRRAKREALRSGRGPGLGLGRGQRGNRPKRPQRGKEA